MPPWKIWNKIRLLLFLTFIVLFSSFCRLRLCNFARIQIKSLENKIMQQAQKAHDAHQAFQLFLANRDFVYERCIKFIVHHFDPSALIALSNSQKKSNQLLPPFDALHVCDLQNGANRHQIVNEFMQCRCHVWHLIDKRGTRCRVRKLDLSEKMMNAYEEMMETACDEDQPNDSYAGRKHLRRRMEWWVTEEAAFVCYWICLYSFRKKKWLIWICCILMYNIKF